MFKKILIGASILVLCSISTSSQAISFLLPANNGGSSNVTQKDEIQDNFFSAGNQVNLEAKVFNDAFLFGSRVLSKGDILGNLFTGAQIVDLSGQIDHDLFAAGSFIDLTDDTVVGGNSYLASADQIVDGLIKGNLYSACSTLEINGTVEGDIHAAVEQLTLGPKSVVKGKISYTSNNDAKITSGASIKEIEKKIPATHDRDNILGKTFWGNKLYSLLGLLLVGVIFLTLVPKKSREIASTIKDKFWSSLGWGLITLIVIPIIVLFSMIIIIGFPLAAILFGAYLTAIYLAKIFAGITIGSLISRGKWLPIWSMTLGLIVILLITMLPWIGELVNFLIILAGLGAIYLVIKEAVRKR